MLKLSLVLAVAFSTTAFFTAQTPSAIDYHVILSFTNTGQTYTFGQQVPIKVMVWDDNQKPVTGASVLVSANGETNTARFLTTDSQGVATFNWSVAQSPGYSDWWLPSGVGVGTNLIYAQFVGDSSHPSVMDVRHVPISRIAAGYNLMVKDGSGNALPEIQTYVSGSKMYKMYVTYAGTSTPVSNVAVRCDSPAAYGYCMTDSNGYCSMTVDMEGLRRGANELFFYTKVSNTLGGVWSQSVWRTTAPAYVPYSYPREKAQQMWWFQNRWWYENGEYKDCAILCGCSESNQDYDQSRTDRAYMKGFGDFYDSKGNYDLSFLRNTKNAIPSGIKVGVYIYDRLAGNAAGELYTGAAYCYDGSTYSECQVSNVPVYNTVSYPLGKFGVINNSVNGYVVKSYTENYVYIFPPYGDKYADEVVNLFRQFSAQEFDYAATPFVNFAVSIGGDGEIVLLETGAQSKFPNIQAVPGLSSKFSRTIGEIQRQMRDVQFAYSMPIQRNINVTYTDYGLYGIGRIGAGVQSAWPEMPMITAGWLQPGQQYAMLTSKMYRMPTWSETKNDGIFQGDDCSTDDYSGFFFRGLMWAPYSSGSDWHRVTNECPYARADSGSSHAQYITALVEQVKLQTSLPGSETDSGLAYLLFRSASQWPGGSGYETHTVPSSDAGAFMYRLDSWGVSTMPRYYADLPSGGRAGTYFNNLNPIAGGTAPTVSQGEVIPSGGKIYVNTLGSWKWHDATMSKPVVRILVMANAHATLRIHYSQSGVNTYQDVAITNTGTWQMKETTLTNAIPRYGVDGKDFALEAVGGPVWILLFMVDNTEDTTIPAVVPPQDLAPTPTFAPVPGLTLAPTSTPEYLPTWTPVPGYDYFAATDDSTLDAWNPTVKYGASREIRLRGGVWNGLLKFDVSGIPAGATIRSASLLMYIKYRTNSCYSIATIYPLLVPFAEMETTWGTRATEGDWNAAGAMGMDSDYSVAYAGTLTMTIANGPIQSTDITDLVNIWRYGDNHGIVLHSAGQCSVGYYTSSSEDELGVPQLVIEYAATATPTPAPTPTMTPTHTPSPTMIWRLP